MYEDWLERINDMSEDEVRELMSRADSEMKGVKFVPFAGTQARAYFSEADIMLFGGKPSGGKMLCKNTLVPVPLGTNASGYKNHGDLIVGDYVYGADGLAKRVLQIHETVDKPDAYEVEFSTGEVFKCDARHCWETVDLTSRQRRYRGSDEWRRRRRENRESRAKTDPKNAGAALNVSKMNSDRVYNILQPEKTVLTTTEIKATLKKNGKNNHSVGIIKPVNPYDLKLPVDPYLLGLWLGDGSCSKGEICMAESDFNELSKYLVGDYSERIDKKNRKTPVSVRCFYGLKVKLRELGVLTDKRIPAIYLRAGISQRIELLRGMMDTDGTCGIKGWCELGFSNKGLSHDALDLINGLGIKSSIHKKELSKKNGNHRDHYRMKFFPDFSVFKLSRKVNRQRELSWKQQNISRSIVSVEKCSPVPMNCITVEGGLYCLGRSYIVTHNSALINGLAIQEHYRSLLVRRNHSDLRPLIDVAKELLGSGKGFIGGGRPMYNKSGGGVIHYMGLSADGGLGGLQGEPHDLICVGRDTPVLMGDGDYKAIQDIVKGDIVMTLEGGKSVLSAHGRMDKDSVCIVSPSGSQIQSVSHSVMGGGVWFSYQSVSSLPILCRTALIAWTLFYKKLQESLLRLEHLTDRMVLSSLERLIATVQESMDLLVSSFYTGQEDRDSVFLEYCGQLLLSLQHLLLFSSQLKPYSQLHELFLDFEKIIYFVLSYGEIDGQKKSLFLGYLYRYLKDSRLYGEHIHEFLCQSIEPTFSPVYLHQQRDAEPPNPIGLINDVQGGTPRHTCHSTSYVHPYTTDKRQASELIFLSFSYMYPVGKKEVYDIHVEGVNHYITAGGFINKNCVDEVAQITEEPVRTIMGWLRPTTKTPKGQRLRVVFGSNPPLDSTGDWLIDFFPCWLDDTYPNPAQDGELRWFIRDGGVDVECKQGDSVVLDGDEIFAHSRTFIASDYHDNPYVDAKDYLRTLGNMSEEQRKILMSGNFLVSRGDAERQMIPTAWIKAAQDRWKKENRPKGGMQALGVDVTGDGEDKSAALGVYDGLWFDEPATVIGSEIPLDSDQAAWVVKNRRGACPVGIDMGGGYGGGTYSYLIGQGIECIKFVPQGATRERSADRSYGFANIRSLSYWRMREMLDPDQEGGAVICLPPSKKLLSDLATPKFEVVMMAGRMVVKMESKKEIKKRIKRSPDEGDAAVIGLHTYMKAGKGGGSQRRHSGVKKMVANVGFPHRKKRWK